MGTRPASTPRSPETHFPAKCKNIIYLHMVGGPAQMDLYDYKPKMEEYYDKDLPESIRKGQRLTTMTSGQARFPIAPSKYKFAQHGKCGMWMHANCCRTRRRWPTTCASSARCTPRRSTTSRRSPTCRPATRSPAGRASARGRATASAAEREPADVRGAGRQAERTRSRCRRSRRGSGSRATCPASTRPCRSARPATRSCSSTTRRA